MGTKILATIGPATCDRDALLALAEAGMSAVRLNGSHADLDWHRQAIALTRATLPNVPILLDIPGRKIRTTALAHEPSFAAGEIIILTTETGHDGSRKVPVNYDGLHADLKSGDTVLADDGTLRFVVESISDRDIACRAMTAGVLRSRKGINVPHIQLGTAMVTDRDRQMMAFARETGVDFVGISFVESAEHVNTFKTMAQGGPPQILAKIENQGGMTNMREIIEAADAIMIDRGDLSVETSLETLAIYQKMIVEAARAQGKPVVVATEMLHSMIENNFPTKAEVADITNAVFDGCSATMLSGETAVGRFPVEAVSTMRRVAEAAFQHLNPPRRIDAAASASQAMEDAIALILHSVPITKVVAVTRSGYAARMIAARAVAQPILAITDDAKVVRAFNMYAGVEGVHYDGRFPRGSADHVMDCIRQLYDAGKLDLSDQILVTGAVYPRSGTRMNLIQVHRIEDLALEFGWRVSARDERR